MTWIVRLTAQGCDYGPFTDRQVADQFAAFLTAEVDPATVEPAGPMPLGLMDPVRELLAWRETTLDPTDQAPPPPSRDTTALGALKHLNHDSATAAMSLAMWLGDPNADAGLPSGVDRMLAHIAETVEAARALLAREAADLTRIRTIGDPNA